VAGFHFTSGRFRPAPENPSRNGKAAAGVPDRGRSIGEV
jgi:hypothetical protein